MNSRLWLITVALVIALGWWAVRISSSDRTTTEDGLSQKTFNLELPAKKRARDQLSSSSAPIIVTAPFNLATPASAPPSKQTYPHTVFFRVVNGLAIAQGDLLLGKTTSGDLQIDHGYYDVPPINLWDRPDIPFLISPELSNPQRVEKAIEYMNRETPVHFFPFSPDSARSDLVVFEPAPEAEHCLSYVGRTGGAQPIRLAPSCQWTEILHEMMHSLGFIHEHSRPDRDQYVDILWNNIEEKFRSQFDYAPEAWAVAMREFPFDYHSVMLYRPNSFAISPDLLTLKSKKEEPVAPTQTGLSQQDIQRLKALYSFTE